MHRITREFTDFDAFWIARAAALLYAGVRRASVARCMRRLTQRRGPGSLKSDTALFELHAISRLRRELALRAPAPPKVIA